MNLHDYPLYGAWRKKALPLKMRDVPDIGRGRRLIDRDKRVDTVVRIQPTCGRTSSANDGSLLCGGAVVVKNRNKKAGAVLVLKLDLAGTYKISDSPLCPKASHADPFEKTVNAFDQSSEASASSPSL
jgi:hypothetical protein